MNTEQEKESIFSGRNIFAVCFTLLIFLGFFYDPIMERIRSISPEDYNKFAVVEIVSIDNPHDSLFKSVYSDVVGDKYTKIRYQVVNKQSDPLELKIGFIGKGGLREETEKDKFTETVIIGGNEKKEIEVQGDPAATKWSVRIQKMKKASSKK